MEDRLRELTKDLRAAIGASEKAIADLASSVPVRLPTDYLEFVGTADGAEGFVGESYLAMWPISEIGGLNEAYAVSELAPGILLFASDGGDIGYAFTVASDVAEIVQTPLVGMSIDTLRRCGATFLEFLEKLASGECQG